MTRSRASGSRTAASTGYSRSHGSKSTVAFGGSAYGSNNGRNGYGGNAHRTYAFQSHPGWSHNRQYDWNGHHYGWFDGAWYIIDPYSYGYGYYGPNYGYDNGGSVSIQVQTQLARDGYYRGPIDGVVGPGTRAAIAAYQRDNGLRVTGGITGGLLNSLGIG